MFGPWRHPQSLLSLSTSCLAVVSIHHQISHGPAFCIKYHNASRTLRSLTTTSLRQKVSLPILEREPVEKCSTDLRIKAINEDKSFFEVGDFVELNDGDFFKIVKVMADDEAELNTNHSYHGWRFRRVKRTLGLDRGTPNEVYLVLYKTEMQKILSNGLQKLERSEIARKTESKLLLRPSTGNDGEAFLKSTKLDNDKDILCRWKHILHTTPQYVLLDFLSLSLPFLSFGLEICI